MKNKYLLYTFKNNTLLSKALPKISKEKPKNITHLNLSKGINKKIKDTIEKTDLFYFGDKIVSFIGIPLFPVIIQKNNKTQIITSSLQLQIWCGFSESNNKQQLIDDFLKQIKLYIGAFFTNNKELFEKAKDLEPDKTILGFKQYEQKLYKKINVYKTNQLHTHFISKNKHGWLNNDSALNLEFIIKKFPQFSNVVEFGSWYGKSVKFMLEHNKDLNIVCFDKFQSIFESSYWQDKTKISLMDKFYLKYPRIETFLANVSPGNVTAVKMNILNVFELLDRYKIQMDFCYIDFEKNTNRLVRFISKLLEMYPDVIIIQDDLVFKSVKVAMKIVRKKLNINVYIIEESAIICKRKLLGYDSIISKSKSYISEKEKIEKLAKNNEEYNSNNTYYQAYFIQQLIENHHFREANNAIIQSELDMNTDYGLYNSDTFFHIIAKVVYLSKGELNQNKIFSYFNDKPKLIKNDLEQTFKDTLQKYYEF